MATCSIPTAPSRGSACSTPVVPDGATGVLLATAHPAKFPAVVSRALGTAVDVPPALADALARPRMRTDMPANYAALASLLRG